VATALLHVTGIGWVLPGGCGSGAGFLELARTWRWQPADNAALAEFSAKDYLTSVKGYLDPASAFCLAATALALGERTASGSGGTLRLRSGICTISRYGATLSGYRFTEQLLRKGPRFASPLVFPHGYANTAGNLAAIEFGFAGPHMVLYGEQDVREALEFAARRLHDGSADDMLVTAYESAAEPALPDGRAVAHGALALRLQAQPDRPTLLTLDLAPLRALPAADTADGMTAALLRTLAGLSS
jgi:3-oxoacyl-(acyl-carrier-protein) synthase